MPPPTHVDPIPRRRRHRKFSLIISSIGMPSIKDTNHRDVRVCSGAKQFIILFLGTALLLLLLWISFVNNSSHDSNAGLSGSSVGVRNKYSSANIIQSGEDEEHGKVVVEGPSQEVPNDTTSLPLHDSGRPFEYIGDIDPTQPLPWPEKERDWWVLHDVLVERVRQSDALPMIQSTNNENNYHLPQLVFYGDSITEGWNGTTFGNTPGPHRMWSDNEPKLIRETFAHHFGENSTWGQRALRPPLILGISGSKTYDFIWRMKNGEFPTSSLMAPQENDATNEEKHNDGDSIVSSDFKLENLERIYIILMGTNNLGGGMLPEPTIHGMDAAGRTLLQQIKDTSPPNTPSAILFSELLPRKDNFRAIKMCPPRCKNMTTLEPYKSFTPAIDTVNRGLPEVMEGWRRDFPNSRVVLLSSQSTDDGGDYVESLNNPTKNTHTVQCGKDMFAMDIEEDFYSHMPDGLHPNSKGYDVWARCLKKGLEAIMNHMINLN